MPQPLQGAALTPPPEVLQPTQAGIPILPRPEVLRAEAPTRRQPEVRAVRPPRTDPPLLPAQAEVHRDPAAAADAAAAGADDWS